ncbi:hypothetical protein GUJ93_ZPchr0006g43453 [Zizania palustris]|uniref:Uncharacterized protein n=1 Tax=Zizania palustris TaxID=103762 RepID=A0A8J5SK17_ZIZPA|nr:hypothetical protein GUJ93_ZPchr0006g43453 [Zizania palustris]
MDNKGKRTKDSDDSSPSPPRKGNGKLKFAPKVRPKKDPKIAPKMEIQEESKDYTISKDVMMKLRIPQDYTHTNYPITLPLRRPYSGNPAIPDEEEFEQSSSNRDHDGKLTAAKELGLTASMDKPELIFFQLPLLPKEKSVTEEESTTSKRHQPKQGCRLNEFPGGLMGKMLVYRSGKVKMKLGDVQFDVSAGVECIFAQEVVAINTREKHCCSLGEISKCAVVTPDTDYLLGSIEAEYRE